MIIDHVSDIPLRQCHLNIENALVNTGRDYSSLYFIVEKYPFALLAN